MLEVCRGELIARRGERTVGQEQSQPVHPGLLVKVKWFPYLCVFGSGNTVEFPAWDSHCFGDV